MSLDIHPNCRTRLAAALAEALPSIQATNGMFIERRSLAKIIAAEFILPRTGKLHDRLVEYLDEFPLTDFISDTLGQELYELDRYLADQTINLTAIEGYNDPSTTSKRLLDDFESLPWSYRLTIPLPPILNELVEESENERKLSDEIRIVRPDKTFTDTYPLNHPNKQRRIRLRGGPGLFALLDMEPPQWEADRLYIQIGADGFVGQYGGTPAAHEVERNLRAFCGASIATRLLKYEYSYTPAPLRTSVYVHRKTGNGVWEPQTRYELSESVSRGLSYLKINDLEGRMDTQVKRRSWIHYRLEDIETLFQSGQRADPIILASQWLFDSHAGQDQLLSFIQSMVVLEIILGDKTRSDEIGIGELISNRFAYLIGTTLEERAELLAAFKKIYRVRSQIVHSGKHKLTLDERSLFLRLRWMCRRLIDKEIDLLKAGIPRRTQLQNPGKRSRRRSRSMSPRSAATASGSTTPPARSGFSPSAGAFRPRSAPAGAR
jgi:hypothetical protein